MSESLAESTLSQPTNPEEPEKEQKTDEEKDDASKNGKDQDPLSRTASTTSENGVNELSDKGGGEQNETSDPGMTSSIDAQNAMAEKKDLDKQTVDTGKDSDKETVDTGKNSDKETADTGKNSDKETADTGKDSDQEKADTGNDSNKEKADTEKTSEKETIETEKNSYKGTADTGKNATVDAALPDIPKVKIEPEESLDETSEAMHADDVKESEIAMEQNSEIDESAVQHSHVNDAIAKDTLLEGPLKVEEASKCDDVTMKLEEDEMKTDISNVPKDNDDVSDKPNGIDTSIAVHEHVVASVKEVESSAKEQVQPPAGEETTSNMGVLLKAVKIEEKEPCVEFTIKPDEAKKNEYDLMDTKSDEVIPQTLESEQMHIDAVKLVVESLVESAVQKKESELGAVFPESKAVHEIIAEQSNRGERESIIPTPVASEKSDTVMTTEAPVPSVPDTKVEIHESVDDWDIPASDEEEDGSRITEGECGDKRKRTAVKRGYWEPPAEVIVELYRRLDREGILELSWKCPGRRPPSEEGDREEEKEQPEVETNQEDMEISQEEEDPTEFDFDIDTDSSVQKMTPRRGIGMYGSGQAQGSGKKRVARMDKVLDDIFRHRKIDSALIEEKKPEGDEVPMETDEAMDTTPANVTPSRPPDKFHIRSDLT